MFGWYSIEPVDHGASNFSYVQPDYVFDPKHFWQSPYYSSETVLAAPAVRLSGATSPGKRFDIRAMGAVHAALFLAAFGILLSCLRRTPVWSNVLIWAVVVFVFTDVAYTSYLNSFFMDAAALGGMLLLIAAAIRLAQEPDPSFWYIGVYAFAGLIYVTAKTQHALWMFLPAGYIVYLSCRWRRRSLRKAGIAAAVVIIAGGVLELATADPGNRAQALFNKLFFDIGREGPQGADDLRALGVQEQELRFIGTHSYAPGSPASDIQWAENFYSHTGYPRLFAWYFHHPSRATRILWRTLANDAPELRQNNLANVPRAPGLPPAAKSSRFSAWSGLRSTLIRRWPVHMVIWYVLFLAGAAVEIVWGSARFGWLAVMVAVFGIAHFSLAALADCLETGRHLLFFQVSTDLMVCFAVAGLVQVYRYFTNRTELPRSL